MASVLEEVLLEEYTRACRLREAFLREAEELPRGYVSVKRIGGHEYSYLQWREGGRVCSRYLPADEAVSVSAECARRRELAAKARGQEGNMRQIRRALGRAFGAELDAIEADAARRAVFGREAPVGDDDAR